MPADILRDLAVNPPTATAPEPVPLESSLERERERAVAGREEAYAGARQALERRSEAVRGPAEAARAATEAPLASPPESPVLPSPPSLRPRAFLEGPGDEPPIQTLQRFLAGMGTIASSFGSLVMGDAATANAALTGALRGWKKGDVERMNLEMTRWKNATDLALNKADLARKNYRDILENQKLSLDQKMKAMEITAAMHGDQILLHELDAKRWDNAIKELDHRQDVLTKFRMQVANLEMKYMMARSLDEQRRIGNELAAARLEETKAHNREMERLAGERAEEKGKLTEAQAKSWFNRKGENPEPGMPRSEAAEAGYRFVGNAQAQRAVVGANQLLKRVQTLKDAADRLKARGVLGGPSRSIAFQTMRKLADPDAQLLSNYGSSATVGLDRGALNDIGVRAMAAYEGTLDTMRGGTAGIVSYDAMVRQLTTFANDIVNALPEAWREDTKKDYPSVFGKSDPLDIR